MICSHCTDQAANSREGYIFYCVNLFCCKPSIVCWKNKMKNKNNYNGKTEDNDSV